MTFGYDIFNDKRFANNHQSGSDYRILGTSTIIQGTDDLSAVPRRRHDDHPVEPDPVRQPRLELPHALGVLQRQLAHRRDRLTANLGLRYDKNSGQDQAGVTVITEDAWSPRLGVVFDSDRVTTVVGDRQRRQVRVGHLQQHRRRVVGGRQPADAPVRLPRAEHQPAGTAIPVTSDVAIRQLFALVLRQRRRQPAAHRRADHSWRFADHRRPVVAECRGSTRLASTASSAARAAVRADFVYRNYGNFYADFTAPGERAPGQRGRSYDLVTIGNDDDLAFRSMPA